MRAVARVPGLTRLTASFSKLVERLVAMLTLRFMVHNLVRVDQTLRRTPAMKAGLTDQVWGMGGVVGLVEAREAAPRTEGPP
jgi:hypothetical protein